MPITILPVTRQSTHKHPPCYSSKCPTALPVTCKVPNRPACYLQSAPNCPACYSSKCPQLSSLLFLKVPTTVLPFILKAPNHPACYSSKCLQPPCMLLIKALKRPACYSSKCPQPSCLLLAKAPTNILPVTPQSAHNRPAFYPQTANRPACYSSKCPQPSCLCQRAHNCSYCSSFKRPQPSQLLLVKVPTTVVPVTPQNAHNQPAGNSSKHQTTFIHVTLQSNPVRQKENIKMSLYSLTFRDAQAYNHNLTVNVTFGIYIPNDSDGFLLAPL